MIKQNFNTLESFFSHLKTFIISVEIEKPMIRICSDVGKYMSSITQVDHSNDRIRSKLSRFRHSFYRSRSVPSNFGKFLGPGFRSEVQRKFPTISRPFSVRTLPESNGTGYRNVKRNPGPRKSPEQKQNRPEPTGRK